MTEPWEADAADRALLKRIRSHNLAIHQIFPTRMAVRFSGFPAALEVVTVDRASIPFDKKLNIDPGK